MTTIEAIDTTLVESSVSATVHAPIERIDIPAWCFGLSESEYQACSPAHCSAGATIAPDERMLTFDPEVTALLVIDPYNDFISEGGKTWDRLRAVAEANDCVTNLLAVLHAARRAQLQVAYALHHRYRPGDYETWKHMAPVQRAAWRLKVFELGSWGAEIRAGFEPLPGDIVAQEHWCSSGFAGTDLDQQ